MPRPKCTFSQSIIPRCLHLWNSNNSLVLRMVPIIKNRYLRPLLKDYGEGLPPVSLPRKEPVAQLVVGLRCAAALFLQPPHDRCCCFLCAQPIQAQPLRLTAGAYSHALP